MADMDCAVVGGYGFYYSILISAVAIAAITTGALGLKGVLDLRQVSIASLVTGVNNPVTFIISILGLTGSVSAHLVSSVTIACGTLTFAVAACSCCCSAGCCAFGLRS